MSSLICLEFPDFFWVTLLFLRIIYKSDVAWVPWTEHYSVLQSERGKGWRLEAEGEITNDKVQMPNGNELVGCISLIGFIG